MEAWQDARQIDRQEGKISRGWRLTQVAWRLIRSDRTMLVLALAGIVSATAFTLLVFYLGGYFSPDRHSSGHLSLVALIALYPSTVASVFFNVALACAASAAFDGDRMSASEAIRMAYGKRRRILLWSLISALVGTLIAEIANRLPGGAKLIAWFAGAAWGLATIFVIPILAMEGVGAVDALKRSSGLVKRRWGEGISGRISIGAWAIIATVPLAIALAVGAALLPRHPATGMVLIGLGLVGLVATITAVAATQQVFAVALYRYAIDAPIGGFTAADLDYPFTPAKARRKRKSWILRIGGPILALLLLLIVIGIVTAPRHHPHATTAGYLSVTYGVREASELPPGTPVVFQRRVIGTIVGSESIGPRVRIEFRVAPGFSWLRRGYSAFIGRAKDGTYLGVRGLVRPRPPG